MTTSPLAHIALPLNRAGDALLPLLARFVFAAVLFFYYWNSGLSKLGNGIFGVFSPSAGGYVQIFPKAMEAVGYDPSQLSIFHWAVVTSGTIAELILPVLIVIGLLTRLAAVGMIGFITVQSVTDVFAHGVEWGAWFDQASNALILDQRAFWVLCLLILVLKGAGALSVDRGLFGKPAAV